MDTSVDTNWINTTSALPRDGSAVEFLLDGREYPMRGCYLLGHFETRWSSYEPASVRHWRSAAEHEYALRNAI